MILLYNFISLVGLLLYLPRLLTKKGPGDRTTFIRERLGMSRYSTADLWVHAVSVGETLACIPFLKKLKKELPGKKIVLSTTTYTGQKIAREKFPEADRVMYMPIDSVLCVKRVVGMMKPSVFATVETELWPALFQSLKKSGSRIIILNGRISDTSFRGYRKIAFFTKKILSPVDFFYMQDKLYADRMLSLGADIHKVGVMGNFKFDIVLDIFPPLKWLAHIEGRKLLAASTHKGEEEIVLDAWEKAKSLQKDLKLILAPRHPERFREVEELIRNRGFNLIKRSEIKSLPVENSHQPVETSGEDKKTDTSVPDVILMDTIGELSRAFSHVDVAFIGGSLVPVGGHNVMEPAYWSKPILFGPYMDNFPIAGEFLKDSAALSVRDSGDMAEKVMELLGDNKKAADMGQKARSIVDRNTGAVKKAVELVGGYFGTV